MGVSNENAVNSSREMVFKGHQASETAKCIIDLHQVFINCEWQGMRWYEIGESVLTVA